ncbi:hypothetical protein RHGRI_022590 [Rhododendron griersonianum]|uniref:Uncharacterized protein n=1 Tax=Rhododendron griersonianum TaxID=479676 RepID=A0AAV6J4Y7_9ERIC|nr:hypothetical protein RHGRI_022590 [Rhododendron griersonianum]
MNRLVRHGEFLLEDFVAYSEGLKRCDSLRCHLVLLMCEKVYVTLGVKPEAKAKQEPAASQVSSHHVFLGSITVGLSVLNCILRKAVANLEHAFLVEEAGIGKEIYTSLAESRETCNKSGTNEQGFEKWSEKGKGKPFGNARIDSMLLKYCWKFYG